MAVLGVSMEIHLEMLRVALHTICTMMFKKKQQQQKNRIRSGWMRLFVRAEVDGVKRARQSARQAGQPAGPMQSF